jgi:hypothetical protein
MEKRHAILDETRMRSGTIAVLLLATANAAQESDAAGRDVAVDVVTSAQKDDAVTGRVGLIVFQLVIRNDDLGSNIHVLAAQWCIGAGVGDDGDIPVAIDLEGIRPIGIRFAAA